MTAKHNVIYECSPLVIDEKNLKDKPINRKFLFIAALIANLSSFTCGLAFGWSSPEIPKFKEFDSPLANSLTLDQESWIGSLLPIGAAVGPFIAGVSADKIGRKPSLIIGIFPFILSFVIAMIATEVYHIYILRFLSGLGVGFVFTVLPMYISEISDDKVKGQLGCVMQLFVDLGQVVSFGAGPYLTIFIFNLILISVPVLFIFLFVMIPESPYFLLKSGKREAALEALIKFRSSSLKSVQYELSIINKNIEESNSNKAGLSDLFKTKPLRKAVIISIALVFFQQASGINVIVFYAQDIFQDAGSTLPPEIAVMVIGMVQIFGGTLTQLLMKKHGKRCLLLISAIGMSISESVLAYFFYLKESGEDVKSISWLPITCLISFNIIFCMAFGPLPWAVTAELFPGNVKSLASSLTASSCWFLAFIITKYFTIIVENLGQNGLYALFGLLCLFAANFIYVYLPETSGKSMEEILKELSK